jgi:hypothetical protein
MGEKKSLTSKLSRSLAADYAVYQKVLANTLRPFAELKAKPKDVRGAKAKVREIVRRLDVVATKWARSAIAEAYKSKRLEVGPSAKKASTFGKPKGKDRAEKSIPRLVETTASNLVKANRTIESSAREFLAAYESAFGAVDRARARVEEAQFMAGAASAEMAKKVKYWLARDLDEGSIARKLRKYLEKLAAGDDFIEVGGKFFELKYYAEMVARSELHNAYVEATVDECKAYDCDLVQFSRHASPCAICAQLEGKVFSISGDDESFPPLDEPVQIEVMTKTSSKTIDVDPRFPHPNCEHNLNPVTRSILRAAGELGG